MDINYIFFMNVGCIYCNYLDLTQKKLQRLRLHAAGAAAKVSIFCGLHKQIIFPTQLRQER